MVAGMYRIWKNGKPACLVASFRDIGYEEYVDMWTGSEWVAVMVDGKWV